MAATRSASKTTGPRKASTARGAKGPRAVAKASGGKKVAARGNKAVARVKQAATVSAPTKSRTRATATGVARARPKKVAVPRGVTEEVARGTLVRESSDRWERKLRGARLFERPVAPWTPTPKQRAAAEAEAFGGPE